MGLICVKVVVVQCDSLYWHCQLQQTCPVKLTIGCGALTYNFTKNNASWAETSVFPLFFSSEFKPGAKCYIYNNCVITCFSDCQKVFNSSTKHCMLDKQTNKNSIS